MINKDEVNNVFNVLGTGKQIRDYAFVSDTVNAFYECMIHPKKSVGRIFNVAGGFEQKNIDTAMQILECYFGKGLYTPEEHLNLEYKRKGQDVRYALNDEKLRALGWKPKCNFDKARAFLAFSDLII